MLVILLINTVRFDMRSFALIMFGWSMVSENIIFFKSKSQGKLGEHFLGKCMIPVRR